MSRIFKICIVNFPVEGANEVFLIKPTTDGFNNFQEEIFNRLPELKTQNLKIYYEDTTGEQITILNDLDFGLFQEQTQINKVFIVKSATARPVQVSGQPNHVPVTPSAPLRETDPMERMEEDFAILTCDLTDSDVEPCHKKRFGRRFMRLDRSRSHSRERSRGRSRGHSRGQSRGHSRGHSRGRRSRSHSARGKSPARFEKLNDDECPHHTKGHRHHRGHRHHKEHHRMPHHGMRPHHHDKLHHHGRRFHRRHPWTAAHQGPEAQLVGWIHPFRNCEI